MRNYSSLTSLAVLALGFAFVAPAARADNSPCGEKSSQPCQRVLKKYDLNKNGHLDPDEQAAWDADKAKKAEKPKPPKAPKPKVGDAIPADSPLAKYDANKNGLLDADELAAWKADHKKAKKCKDKPCEPPPPAPEPAPAPAAK